MIRVDVRASVGPHIYDVREMSPVDQHVVYLGASVTTRVSPGVFSDILTCEVGTADCHPSSSSECHKAQTIIVGNRMKAFRSNDRPKETFSADLRICISDDYFDILFWALSVGLIKALIELILHVIGFVVRWRIDADQAVVEELALHPQHTDSVAYRLPPNNSLHLLPDHYKANSAFCLIAAAVVDVVLE